MQVFLQNNICYDYKLKSVKLPPDDDRYACTYVACQKTKCALF